MSDIHICFMPKMNCWNRHFPFTCYGCGCCASEKRTRYENRIRHLEECIEEQKHFDRWDDDPEMRKVQETNVKANLRYFKRFKRYYAKKLKEMDGDGS